MSDWNELRSEFLEYLLDGETDQAILTARETLDKGAQPMEFFEECISPTLREIGQRFETLDIFLPEMVIAAEVVQEVNDQVINPAIEADQSGQVTSAGKVLLATVQGDLHDIGKNMVDMMLQVNGFKVINLGINVPADTIVERAEKEQVDIIGLSALLTTTLPYMKETIDYLEGKNLRDRFAVIVGGAALTPDYADKIGVDGHGRNAADAVIICKEIMAAKKGS